MMTHEPSPEFSVEVDLESLPAGGKRFQLKADAAARAGLAKRFGVPSIDSLAGEIALQANKKVIKVEGSVKASLRRVCVVSLEEMTESVSDAFEIEFLRDPDAEPVEDEEFDMREFHEDAVIDIGEILAQQLSLAMDPFPRIDGAERPVRADAHADSASPFAGLREKLKKP